ncbi:MAG: DUF2027 domain-containing protein [Bacteroidia bacterium]|nr:DUF2027 domain-containing protein [Bacteroidia bacterium]
MKFQIGQKVRFLYQSGEGIITSIIDKKTVEVDLGDDFPVDFPIDELIVIDRKENILLPKVEKEEKKETPLPVKLGIHLMDLSLAVSKDGEEYFELYLINPEKWDMQYVCHCRLRSKFMFLSAGSLKSQGVATLTRFSSDELMYCKEFHFQFLHYTQGPGLPQAPMEKNYAWNPGKLDKEPLFIDLIKNDAWLFGLRDRHSQPEPVKIENPLDALYSVVTPQEVKLPKTAKIVDLHIEKIVKDTRGMDNAAMLFAQLNAFEKAISDALADNHQSLIIIHGVGEGRLKSRILEKLGFHPKVKQFKPADMLKFGGGATEIWFK